MEEKKPCLYHVLRDADLVAGEGRDAELDEDHGDELEVNEEEISACAPYLVRQMSCLGRVTPGVQDTPFLGSARGAKEAVDLFTGGSSSEVSVWKTG